VPGLPSVCQISPNSVKFLRDCVPKCLRIVAVLARHMTCFLASIMVAFFFKICQVRLIQSSEKEHADLSGRSGHGHLVLICTERRRPRPLLKVNKLCLHPAAQIGVAKSDFSQMRRSRSDSIKNA